jgi:hypothetical protein
MVLYQPPSHDTIPLTVFAKIETLKFKYCNDDSPDPRFNNETIQVFTCLRPYQLILIFAESY